MESTSVQVVDSLKRTEELSSLVSKGLAQVIRFSTNQGLKESCLNLLGVHNSSEAEKVIYLQLTEWKKRHHNEERISEIQKPAQKHKCDDCDSQLTKMIRTDLEDWE